MNQPARPYTQDGQPSSGYAQGVETSRAAEPLRAHVQNDMMNQLAVAGVYGLTWYEMARVLREKWPAKYGSVHHGTVSGALSALHKEKRIARLTERRDRRLVYVHINFVRGRETRPQGRQRTCPHCGEEL